MIGFDIRLTLSNPLQERDFRSLWNKTWILSENKAFEIDTFYYSGEIVSARVDLTFPLQRDHHGLEIEIALLGLHLCFSVYDKRHVEDFEEDPVDTR